jgi:DNA-binding beta-propeller fold protein YncE
MVIFSPDGRYAYVSSSGNFTGGSPTPDAVVIDAVSRAIVGRIPQASPFSPNIAATPDGKQVRGRRPGGTGRGGAA